MDSFLGFVPLGTPLTAAVVTRDGSSTPRDASPAPAFRVYGPAGLMANGTGSLAFKDPSAAGGPVSGATNASPIVVTSPGHNLSSGTRVTLAGVSGNTGANGDFQVTVIDGNTFSLDGSTGSGAYTSGGTWHVSGLYNLSLTPTGGNGYAPGQNYTVLVTATVAGTAKADTYTFTVV
jgi:hypothetical protein